MNGSLVPVDRCWFLRVVPSNPYIYESAEQFQSTEATTTSGPVGAGSYGRLLSLMLGTNHQADRTRFSRDNKVKSGSAPLIGPPIPLSLPIFTETSPD